MWWCGVKHGWGSAPASGCIAAMQRSSLLNAWGAGNPLNGDLMHLLMLHLCLSIWATCARSLCCLGPRSHHVYIESPELHNHRYQDMFRPSIGPGIWICDTIARCSARYDSRQSHSARPSAHSDRDTVAPREAESTCVSRVNSSKEAFVLLHTPWNVAFVLTIGQNRGQSPRSLLLYPQNLLPTC
jgi:hypothetical protein